MHDEAPLDVAGRVAAAAAHDFNNHVAAIALQTELALGQLGPEDGKLRRRLEGILGSCERARDLTRDLLAFGGRRPLSPEPVDVAKAVERLAGPRVSVSVAEAPLQVLIDPERLDDALTQLAGDGGAVVSAAADGDVAEVRITRRGGVVDEEARRRFFEPFATEDGGIELATVYGFVRQSGGTIALESGSDGGSVIVVRLPRARS